MPTYEYTCEQCNTVFEKKMTVKEKINATITCPACNAEDVRQIFFGVGLTGKKTGGKDVSGGCCGGRQSCC
jgi:putative FmdB family regulatory protein